AEGHRSGGKLAARDGLHPEVRRQEGQQVLLGDEAEVEEQPLETLATLLLETLDLAQVVRADASLLEQQLLERAVLEFHGPTKKHTRAPLERQARADRLATPRPPRARASPRGRRRACRTMRSVAPSPCHAWPGHGCRPGAGRRARAGAPGRSRPAPPPGRASAGWQPPPRTSNPYPSRASSPRRRGPAPRAP